MNREQQLFDQLKQSPTELSLQEVNAIISTLPALPPPAKGYYFNLNSLFMLTVSTIIFAMVVFWKKDFKLIEEPKVGVVELEKIIEKHQQFLADLNLSVSEGDPIAEPNSISVAKRKNSSRTHAILINPLPLISLNKLVVDPNSSRFSDISIRKIPLQKLSIPILSKRNPTLIRPIINGNDPLNFQKNRVLGEGIFLSKRLEIKSSDTVQKLKEIEAIFKAGGLSIEVDHRYNIDKQTLEHFLIHFKHAQGMDFQLISTGFDRLQINLTFNDQQQIQHFTYRFNEEAFTNPVPLHCKGFKDYEYTDSMRGERGTTNVNLKKIKSH